MKNILYILGLGLLVISCQKEIDVDLNSADPKLVIEANYTAEDSTVRVMITLSTNYFELSDAPTIDNAVVTIADHLGNVSSVNSLGNGVFELSNYIPIYNTTYTMNVSYDGVNYVAECDMKSPVALENITFDYYPSFFGSQPGYASNLRYYDPVDTVNHYIAILTRNGVTSDSVPNFILQDDLLTDGNLVERPLFVNPLYETGDVIGIELRSIDQDIYYYYDELLTIAGGQSSAAPANPESNWSNKALGYFSAYSNSRKNGTVP
jgi:hypothetical protein